MDVLRGDREMLILGFGFAAALPLIAILLLCAICPVAMFFMMKRTNRRPR